MLQRESPYYEHQRADVKVPLTSQSIKSLKSPSTMSGHPSNNSNNSDNKHPIQTHEKALSGTSSFNISSDKSISHPQELTNPIRSSNAPSILPDTPPQAQKPIRRSLSFQKPLKVATDSSRFSHNRSRARSLPPEPDKKPPTLHSRDRFSLSAISQSPLTTSKPTCVADSSSSVEENTPTEQFLQARGLHRASRPAKR